jgi:F-type H+-transporting ATPase subunit gamma
MSAIAKYRKKIKSAKNIAKITKAMQMVAASKMRRAQDSATRSKVYTSELVNLSSILSSQIDESVHPLLRKSSTTRDLIVIIAPEKGLCGSLVTNISRKLLEIIGSTDASKTDFIVVGKKARHIVGKMSGNIIGEFILGVSQPTYEIVPPITRLIEKEFVDGVVGRVVCLYTEFHTTINQETLYKVLLPLSLAGNDILEKSVENGYKGYIKFEPSADVVCTEFLSMFLETEIYQLLLESYASEQSARMVAMKNATDNAKSLMSQLTLEYNKKRQEMITSEIIDIGNAISSQN